MSDDPGTESRKTRWSLVYAAANGDRSAFGELYALYWEPLYWAARRTLNSHDAATDVVHDFYAWMLDHAFLASADQARGSFRGYLFVAFKRYMSNDYRKRLAAKRSGHPVRIDFDAIKNLRPVSSEPDPYLAFDREWASVVVRNAWSKYKHRFVKSGRMQDFDIEKACLFGELTQDEAAAQLAVDIGTLRTRLSRMRERFRRLLREEVGETIDARDIEREANHETAAARRFEERVSEEIAYLLECLSSTSGKNPD